MKNLESKVKLDVDFFPENNLSFAKKIGILKQKDTYYLLNTFKLKLREEGDFSELIFYYRRNLETSKNSRYIRVPVTAHKDLSLFFLNILFTKKCLVEKERVLFIYKHTRIHLDTVKGLGSFIELETVFSGGLETDKAKKEHEEIKGFLGIDNFPLIAGSYSNLLKVE